LCAKFLRFLVLPTFEIENDVFINYLQELCAISMGFSKKTQQLKSFVLYNMRAKDLKAFYSMQNSGIGNDLETTKT
jgi:flagellar biosynthesis protein FliP